MADRHSVSTGRTSSVVMGQPLIGANDSANRHPMSHYRRYPYLASHISPTIMITPHSGKRTFPHHSKQTKKRLLSVQSSYSAFTPAGRPPARSFTIGSHTTMVREKRGKTPGAGYMKIKMTQPFYVLFATILF